MTEPTDETFEDITLSFAEDDVVDGVRPGVVEEGVEFGSVAFGAGELLDEDSVAIGGVEGVGLSGEVLSG